MVAESNPAEGGGDGGAIEMGAGAGAGVGEFISDMSCMQYGVQCQHIPWSGPHTWSPIAEISTLFPQLEHLIVGKKPISIVAMVKDRQGHGVSGGQLARVHDMEKKRNNLEEREEKQRNRNRESDRWSTVVSAFRGKIVTLEPVLTLCSTRPNHGTLRPSNATICLRLRPQARRITGQFAADGSLSCSFLYKQNHARFTVRWYRSDVVQTEYGVPRMQVIVSKVRDRSIQNTLGHSCHSCHPPRLAQLVLERMGRPAMQRIRASQDLN